VRLRHFLDSLVDKRSVAFSLLKPELRNFGISQ
jgi:hypothetical protein